MMRLFKIEWMKVKSYKAFWILFGGFIITFPLSFWFVARQFMRQFSGKSMEEVMLKNMMGSPFVFPKVWHSAAWVGGMFFVIIGMLFIMLITNEVQYRTHRQNIIDGWSRMDFIAAKTTLLLFFVAISTALVFLTALLIGYIYTPADELNTLFEESYYVLYFALMAIEYLLVAFFVAILVKRTGLSIIIYFAIVCIVDNMLWAALIYKKSQLGYFLPLECVDSLVPNPFKPKMLEQRNVDDWTLMAAALIYIIGLGYLLINHFKKTDLKT
jgi:ABC-2 type transport system permease protein